MEEGIFYTANHYAIEYITTLAEKQGISPIQLVLDFFDPEKGVDKGEINYALNWLFIGTLKINSMLDEISEEWDWDETEQEWKPKDDSGSCPMITVLIVCPRLCTLYYGGEIEVENPEQVKRLKGICVNTINGILQSQEWNCGIRGVRFTEEGELVLSTEKSYYTLEPIEWINVFEGFFGCMDGEQWGPEVDRKEEYRKVVRKRED
jgi:hypothetical protein